MLTLVTRERGLVSVSARSARRSASKLGPLEPMHTLEVGLSLVPGVEVARLGDAKILVPRMALVDDPHRLEAAARVLGWGRALVSAQSGEPRAFDLIEGFLDALILVPREEIDALLVRVGLELLVSLGLGLELSVCVGCGVVCPARASAYVDVERGGLVCRACGGAREILPAQTRAKLARCAEGITSALDLAEVSVGTRLVEDAISLASGGGAAPRRHAVRAWPRTK